MFELNLNSKSEEGYIWDCLNAYLLNREGILETVIVYIFSILMEKALVALLKKDEKIDYIIQDWSIITK